MKLKNYILSDSGKDIDERVAEINSLSSLPEKEQREYEEWADELERTEKAVND